MLCTNSVYCVVAVICAVLKCGNRSGRDKDERFFRLPSVITHQGEKALELSRRRQLEWLARIKRKNLRPEQYLNTRVCSDHFVSGSPSALFDENNPDWAPSLNLGYEGMDSIEAKSGRYERAVKRSTKRAFDELEPETDHEKQKADDEIADEGNSVSTQTDLSMKDLDEDKAKKKDDISHLQTELEVTREENKKLYLTAKKLKQEVEDYSLIEASFKDDDEKVLYYTGLSTWELLQKLFIYVKPYLKQHSSLSPFQQLLITLMRLRLNLCGQDLGYRFKVHASTICRTFEFVIDLLYAKLKPLIIWPTTDALHKTMPMVFRKHYPRCVVIIDCFEIFVDRPTDLLARAQTYLQYKHHNTVKYLIGITPQGTVSYISEGWGGRTSDKYVTEHCSLLSNLVPGDTVLADRGFNISGSYCSTLKIPAFTRGKSQLSGIEVEETRKIANVRIHVERVIGNIRKKFSLLSATQPIDFLTSPDKSATPLDKIVYVCCALVNMCNSVIPFD